MECLSWRLPRDSLCTADAMVVNIKSHQMFILLDGKIGAKMEQNVRNETREETLAVALMTSRHLRHAQPRGGWNILSVK